MRVVRVRWTVLPVRVHCARHDDRGRSDLNFRELHARRKLLHASSNLSYHVGMLGGAFREPLFCATTGEGLADQACPPPCRREHTQDKHKTP